MKFGYSLKGGNSAADSPTATLLRLYPSHKRYLSHPIRKQDAFGYHLLP